MVLCGYLVRGEARRGVTMLCCAMYVRFAEWRGGGMVRVMRVMRGWDEEGVGLWRWIYACERGLLLLVLGGRLRPTAPFFFFFSIYMLLSSSWLSSLLVFSPLVLRPLNSTR